MPSYTIMSGVVICLIQDQEPHIDLVSILICKMKPLHRFHLIK